MSGLLKRLAVPPLYGQVVVECEDATDLPMPETGIERVVATAQSILVATRGDHDGDVTIEVHEGPAEADSGELVFEGELNCPSPKLVVGSSLANALATVDISRSGWIPIRIFVDPASALSTGAESDHCDSADMIPSRRVGARLLVLALAFVLQAITAFVVGIQAHAGAASPPVGATYNYDTGSKQSPATVESGSVPAALASRSTRGVASFAHARATASGVAAEGTPTLFRVLRRASTKALP